MPVPTDLVPFFKALAHESRLRMLGLVAQREHSVQQLAAAVNISEPTASHHLAILRAVGLVAMRADGTTHWYGFVPDTLQKLAKNVFTQDSIQKLATIPRRDSPEAILKNYLDAQGKLTQIPATRKKRYAVLVWLVRQLEEDRRYTEKEINAFLQRFHWDSATLRREFIINRMMARENGVYWRLSDFDWLTADGSEPKVY